MIVFWLLVGRPRQMLSHRCGSQKRDSQAQWTRHSTLERDALEVAGSVGRIRARGNARVTSKTVRSAGNQPNRLTELHAGQQVVVPVSEIVDWLCADELDRPLGGWTQAVLSATIPKVKASKTAASAC
jgi:Uncharacterized protein conserved in bacteria (DUF2314)